MNSTRILTLIVALSGLLLMQVGCGSEDTSDSDTGWINNPHQSDDTDLLADTDVASPKDGGGADTHTDIPRYDSGGDTEKSSPDVGDQPDIGSEVPFPPEELTGGVWYGVWRFSSEPAITGSGFAVDLKVDGSVSIGFREEVTGQWEIFENDRLRLYDLERDGEPNEPEVFVLDIDHEQGEVRGLEMYVPEDPDGQPYVMRFEQLGPAEASVDDVAGDWQSKETYTDEQDNPYRVVVRLRPGYAGYGIYNGAYVEFSHGDALTLTFENDYTVWLIEPPRAGDPKPALAGEIVSGDDGWMIYAPLQTNPGEEPAEFDILEMEQVDAFSVESDMGG